jgi:hypothetical protein
MPGPWGTSADDVPAFPPWVGWYGPWAPPAMHFHRDDQNLLRVLTMKATMQEMTIMDTSAASRTGGL